MTAAEAGYLAAILDGTSHPFALLDANRSFLEFLNLSRESALGRTLWETAAFNGNAVEAAFEAAAAGRPDHFQVNQSTAQGEGHFQFSIRSVSGSGGPEDFVVEG